MKNQNEKILTTDGLSENAVIIKVLLQNVFLAAIILFTFCAFYIWTMDNLIVERKLYYFYTSIVVVVISGVLYYSQRFSIKLKEVKKENIRNHKLIKISSHRSVLLQLFFILIIIAHFYLYTVVGNISDSALVLFTGIMMIKISIIINVILLNSINSVKLTGNKLFLKNLFSKEKEINISEINEVFTLGMFSFKFLFIRYHVGKKEKLALILHPTNYTLSRDSYYALLYAHYYYKENIKIY